MVPQMMANDDVAAACLGGHVPSSDAEKGVERPSFVEDLALAEGPKPLLVA